MTSGARQRAHGSWSGRLTTTPAASTPTPITTSSPPIQARSLFTGALRGFPAEVVRRRRGQLGRRPAALVGDLRGGHVVARLGEGGQEHRLPPVAVGPAEDLGQVVGQQ